VPRIAVTGGVGAGKSEVSRLLAERGATVVDADALAREVVAPGTPGLSAVVREFGPGVLTGDGALDRAGLARLVFADEGARRRLEAIVHPLVKARAAELLARVPTSALAVYDVPLLVEKDLGHGFDAVVVVDVSPETQVERLVRDRGMTSADARARLAAQASRAQRLAVADIVLDNSGTRVDLAARVEELWERLMPSEADPGPDR
jgi:dephospho-CoA kinase